MQQYKRQSPRPHMMWAYYDSHGLPGLVSNDKESAHHQPVMVMPCTSKADPITITVQLTRKEAKQLLFATTNPVRVKRDQNAIARITTKIHAALYDKPGIPRLLAREPLKLSDKQVRESMI